MKYNYLGNMNISVSQLCFGTLTIGPLQANMPLDDGAQIISCAVEKGINFFDTAQLYQTYGYIREGMVRSGKYDIVISTKTYAYTRELAAEAVEQARRELNRDYIDVFMLHEQESILTLKGHRNALEYLYECKEKGIIKAVGASMHHVAAVYGAVDFELDVIHPILNKKGIGIADGNREDMEKAVRAAKNRGTGVFSMKALGGGNLFKEAESSLNYVLDTELMDSIAVGMQSVDEVEANVSFFENRLFTEEQEQSLKTKKRRLKIEDWCSGCGNCVKRCGHKALTLTGEKVHCDGKRCVLCGYCSSACKDFAIKII